MKPKISLLWDCLRQFILSCTTPLPIPTGFFKVESLQLLRFRFKYLISIVFHLAWFWTNQLFIEWGAGGKNTHTHGVLSERNQYCVTLSGYEQAFCTVLSFSSIPDEFLPTLKDNVHSKDYCSLGQHATTFPWTACMSETLQVLFVFPPLQMTSLFSAEHMSFTIFPLFTLKSCLQP